VLADESGRYAPTEWARKAISLYRRHQADRIEYGGRRADARAQRHPLGAITEALRQVRH
jgi:phage terminase large subunit-like protein